MALPRLRVQDRLLRLVAAIARPPPALPLFWHKISKSAFTKYIALKRRLRLRRLARAREEIKSWREYDYLIINRDVEEAVGRLATIIQAERWRTSRLTMKLPDLEVPD
mgnify:CR=1 FL=1